MCLSFWNAIVVPYDKNMYVKGSDQLAYINILKKKKKILDNKQKLIMPKMRKIIVIFVPFNYGVFVLNLLFIS